VAIVLAFPVLILSLMVQMVVLSRINLLHGTADIILLVLIAWSLQEKARTAWIWVLFGGLLVGFVTATPAYIYLISYFVIIVIVRLLRRRVWQTPLLAMLVVTIIGTFIEQVLIIGGLKLVGQPISWQESLTLITLPSVILNLLLALPVYVVITDLASWVYPVEEIE
jgi:rod shape-determining protein MreD